MATARSCNRERDEHTEKIIDGHEVLFRAVRLERCQMIRPQPCRQVYHALGHRSSLTKTLALEKRIMPNLKLTEGQTHAYGVKSPRDTATT